jgi:Fe2+ transport system protein FeoA
MGETMGPSHTRRRTAFLVSAAGGADGGAGRAGARPLTSLAAGESGRVRRIVSDPPELLVKLSSLGLVPGAVVQLQQRRPAAIVRIGETTVALDSEIADGILVDLL